MSLGIRTIWRARAISLRPAGSLIPREPVAPSSPTLSPRPSVTNNLAPLRRTRAPYAARFASTVADAKVDTTPITNPDPPPNSPPAAIQDAGPPTFAERLALIPVQPHDADSILVRSRMVYPHPKETRLNDHLRHQEMGAQTRHDALARAKHEPLPDWRSLLQTLTAMTPRYMKGVVRVIMPKLASHRILNQEVENNLWDIKSQTGCYMVLEQELDIDGNTVLKISGARRAVEQAIDDIVQMARKIKVLVVSETGETVIHDGTHTRNDDRPKPETFATAASNLPKHSCWTDDTFGNLPKPKTFSTTASDLPRPSQWTKEKFKKYVDTLARGHLPSWRANELYPGRQAGHQPAVLKQLVDVFCDPETQPALSPAAFKIALGYIASRGPTARTQARVLFDRMEKMGIRTDTTIFNHLMEATVHDRDLRSFSTCVFLMGRRGHEADFKTWLLFLRLIQSEQVRRYIIQAMNHKNLLASPESLAWVAHEMAPYDAERAILQGLGVDAFLEAQSRLYGPEWLAFGWATPTCNKIIEVMAKHGKWDHVNNFIDFMASRPSCYVYVDPKTLKICLEHARVQTYARSAINLFARGEDLGLLPEKGTLRSLFMAFWYHNMAHAMDVVWQCALLTGNTSQAMVDRIAQVLETGKRMGWNEDPIPAHSETGPTTKRDAKQHALYALLMSSSKGMFRVDEPATESNLFKVLRERGIKMRSKGYVVAQGTLSRALRDAAERDSVFHKSLMQGNWIIEPALLPIGRAEAQGDVVPRESRRDGLYNHASIEADDVEEADSEHGEDPQNIEI